MGTISIADVGLVLVGGYDVKSEDCYEGSMEYECITEGIEGADDDYAEPVAVGIMRGQASMVGIFDDTALKNHALLKAGLGGGARALMFGVDSIGSRFFGLLVEQMNYEIRVVLNELTKAAANFQGTSSGAAEGGMDHDGRVVHAHTQETGASGDTESSSVQNADGATTAGGAGYLEVSQLALGGYTSVTIKLRHSTDDVVYSDLATFTAVDTAPTSERVQITGTINEYVASSYVFNGAGAAQSVTFAAGVVRNEVYP